MDDITKKRHGAVLQEAGEKILGAHEELIDGAKQLASALGPEYPDNWAREKGLQGEGFYWAFLGSHNLSMSMSRMEKHGLAFKDAIEYFRRTLDMVEKLHEMGALGHPK